MLNTFLKKIGMFFREAAPMDVPELCWTDLAQAIQDMPDNTPGTDGIRKGDLLILSPSAIWLLTLLLQAIEKGAAWPDAAATARTAFLSKGEDDLDPRGYRGLAILSKLYRMWASHVGCDQVAPQQVLDRLLGLRGLLRRHW